MKRTFKTLLLGGLVFISAIMGTDVSARSDHHQAILGGVWKFKQAEYMEMPSPTQDYQVKQVISDEEDLFAFGCYQLLAKGADFRNEDVLIVESLYQPYVGRYHFYERTSVSGKKQTVMYFGGIEDMGKDAPETDLKFDAPDIQYIIEFIDENTISITVEAVCTENGVDTMGAVKCIMNRYEI